MTEPEPKFVQGHVGLTPLWVFPHEGEFNGDNGYLCVSTIDEMGLKFTPGLTMEEVREAYVKALMGIFDHFKEEAEENRADIKGAWVVPHYVWAMVGAAINVEMGSDSTQYAVNEAIQRMIATQALFHIGESNPADA